MISKDLLQKLNEQIGLEFESANIYLQMSAWCAAHGLEGCAGFLERGVASMEFRASGRTPLVLLDRNQLCPITGFAQPPPEG